MKALWEKIVVLAGSNLGLKVLALTIALSLWLAGQRDIERSIEVPVEVRNLPAGLMLMDNRVDFVVLRLSGPRRLVSTFDAETLKLGLDLSAAKPGPAIFPLSSSSLNIPRGVTVSRITPPLINLRIEPVLRRILPVSVRFANKLAATHKIASLSVEPARVSVTGPADDVSGLALAETVPVEIEAARAVIKRTIRLSTDGKPLNFTPERVDVVVTVEPATLVKDFNFIKVQANDAAGDYTVTPGSVSLRLAGPGDVMEALTVGSSQVFVDTEGLTPGDYSLPLSFNLPADIKVVEHKPQRFKVRILKPKN
jgi:YbbR domain-containing protein